jgi:hypothetical protein
MMFQVFLPRVGDVRLWPNRAEEIAIEGSYGAILQSPPAAAFLGAFFGCLATLYLSAIGIAPGIASALATTLLCGEVLLLQTPSLLAGELFTAIYGGAFGGMTPVLWLNGSVNDPSLLQVVVLFISLSVFCGVAFYLVAVVDTRCSRPLAVGYGGRSGAIAAVACFFFLELAPLFGADDTLFRAADALDADTTSVALPCLACLIGTFATLFALRRQSFESATTADRTFVAATVALIGLVTLHLNDLGDARTSDAFYAGCFLGMSTPDRLSGRIAPVFASIGLAVLLVQVRMLLPGVGGSLGLAAFVTVVALIALGGMTSFVTRRAIPSGNETAETATRRPAAGSLSQLWTYAGASAWFEPQGLFAVSVLGHPARAYAVLASAAFGCIILPARLAPEKLILDAPPLIQLSQNLAANSAQPDLVPANVNTVDGAGQMGPPSLDIDSVEVRTTQDLWRAEEPVDRQAEHLHRTLDATRTTAQVATPQVSEPAPGGVSAGVTESPPSGASADVTESKEKLFLEFEQWRAARIAGIAGSAAASPKARSKEKRHDRTTPRSGTEPVASSSGSIHAKGSASTDRGQLPR